MSHILAIVYLNLNAFRGWTAQEFVAPRTIRFISRDWVTLNDEDNASFLQAAINRTAINPNVFTGKLQIADCSIAERMSWMSGRQTTRREDMAYCLLGIFEINMPLLYGEGDRAFTRLQEQLLTRTMDQSLLAWSY